MQTDLMGCDVRMAYVFFRVLEYSHKSGSVYIRYNDLIGVDNDYKRLLSIGRDDPKGLYLL